MNITEKHALFYASKKSNLFSCNVSIHELINSQIKSDRANPIKVNNVTQLSMIYNRCKRNNLSFQDELLKSCQSDSISLSRKNYFMKVRFKLLRINYEY